MITPAILTAAQCRAGRALIEWSDEQLAQACGAELQAITEFEARIRAPSDEIKRRMRLALEEAGVVFIAENGGGAGVRLKFSRKEVRAIQRWEAEGGTAAEDDVF